MCYDYSASIKHNLATAPVGLCALCLDGLLPSMRAARLVCLLRCGHQMHSGCCERLYQMKQRCPSCGADSIRHWPEDYAHVRQILDRHQREARTRQTALRSRTAK